MNGREVRDQATSQSAHYSNNRKHQPIVSKTLTDIILEAGVERKRKEDIRRRKNLVVHIALDSKSTETLDRI